MSMFGVMDDIVVTEIIMKTILVHFQSYACKGNSELDGLPLLTSFLFVCVSTLDFPPVSTSVYASGWDFLSDYSSVLVSTPVGTSISASVCLGASSVASLKVQI